MLSGMDGLVDLRRSILASLGLLVACGPAISIDDDGDGDDDSASMGDGSASGSASEGDASGSASVGEGSASGSDDGPVVEACPGATPILQSNVAGSVPTGWEICDDGVIHRTQAVGCEDPLPPGDGCMLPAPQGCLVDADCTEAPFGRCVQQSDPFAKVDYCGCQYGCATDADCEPNRICACGGQASGYPGSSRCIAATCTDDASCGDLACALASGDDGCGITYAAACLTPTDECRSDIDCRDFVDCFPQVDGHWACESFCCCGRPLLVDGRPVTAPAIANTEWSAGMPTRFHTLPDVVRRRIAEHYTRVAQLEHASVASFARFTLELMALGAPPQLLVAAHRAGLDEIDHARRCFALASAYAGQPVGPGRLAVAGACPADTLEAVASALIDEACVGETLAAAEARTACRFVREPAVREVLTTIAADEQRHAELGWRTLRWLLEQMDAEGRARMIARLRESIEAAERELPAAMVDHDRRWLRPHGVLDPGDRRDAQTKALERVLRPCADALASWEPAGALETGS